MASIQPWRWWGANINNERMHLIPVSSFLFFLKKNSHWKLKILADIFTITAFCLQRKASFQSENTYIQTHIYLFFNVLIVLLHTLNKPEGGTPSEGWKGSWRRARHDAGASGGAVTWELVTSPSLHLVRWQGCPQSTQPQGKAERFPPPTSKCLLASCTSPMSEGAGSKASEGPPSSLLSRHNIDVPQPCQRS